MAKKKENLKEMKIEELQSKLLELREIMRALRFKSEGSKSKNIKEYSSFKKQVARILTEINLPTRQVGKVNKK